MPRTADPRRRVELLDAIIDYLAVHGIAQLSLRPLAQALGHSTRVLTHHFADKDALLTAVLRRLDEHQRERLRAFPGPGPGEGTGIGAVVRASWRWHLEDDYLPLIRLLHEIEGLAAGGRLTGYVPTLLTDRAEFVAGLFREYGVPEEAARHHATLLNAAYAGLQADYLITGDRRRTEAALDRLADLAEEWSGGRCYDRASDR